MKKEELLEQIKLAMKAHDKVRLSILRQINQALKQIEVDERREVSEQDITAAMKKLKKVTQEELSCLEKAREGHEERIELLSQQNSILDALLPQQLTGAALEELADKIISDLGASSRRDMGKVMGELSRVSNGNIDKPYAAKYVGQKLS